MTPETLSRVIPMSASRVVGQTLEMGEPMKSAAIRITIGRNRKARRAIFRSETVTEAMLASGFNTKSNFNREFLRVAGASPSDWLKASSTIAEVNTSQFLALATEQVAPRE